MLRLVRPKIGRLANRVVAMDMHDAERLERSGDGEILSQKETIEHELAMQKIEEVADAVHSVTPPTKIAEAPTPRRRGRPRKDSGPTSGATT